MNVTLTKSDKVNGLITLTIEEADYQPKVKKLLKELGQRPIKGFRPGHVPTAMLQKLYGQQALAESINNIVGEELTNYIRTNEVPVLGEPMISDDNHVDFENDKTFTFKFDVALSPEIDINPADVKVNYYEIEVSEEMVKNQDDAFRTRFGKQVEGEEITNEAFVKGSIVELNADGTEKEDGIKSDSTSFIPKYLKNNEGDKMIGKKVGEEIVFNPANAAGDNLPELASMLNIAQDAATDVKSDFKFVASSILVVKGAELCQEFYDSVYGKDTVKTEEEYFAKVKEGLAQQLVGDSNYRFTLDAQAAFLAAAGDVQLPDELLKRYFKMRETDAEKAAKIDEDYPKMRPQLLWQIIKDKLAEKAEIKVDENDLKNIAKFTVAQQFTQYGIFNAPEDVLDRQAGELLKNNDYRRDFAQRAIDDKFFTYLKNTAKLSNKKVSVEEFNKLFEQA